MRIQHFLILCIIGSLEIGIRARDVAGCSRKLLQSLGDRILQRGDEGEDVGQLQEAFQDLGYDIAVDGIFGPQTESVVMDFQKEQGITVDGVVGPETYAALDNAKSSANFELGDRILRRGDQGEDVRQLQQALQDLDYEIAVDGHFGPQTESVVRQFQDEESITVDGIAGPETFDALESSSANLSGPGPTQVNDNISLGYRECIEELQKQYPSWIFEYKQYNVEFDKFVDAQYNLVYDPPLTDIDQYKETDQSIINKRCFQGVTCREGNFFLSTRDGVEFFSRIKHFLNDEKHGCGSIDGISFNDYGIFQFLDMRFDSVSEKKYCRELLEGTYFAKDPNYTIEDFAKWFYDAGQQNGINPIVLIAIALIEAPGELSIGYPDVCRGEQVKLYNYFSWGLTTGCFQCGVDKACQLGWTTPKACIDGFATLFADSYVQANQYSYYLTRWNILSYPDIAHQYAVSIADAWAKGSKMAKIITNLKSVPIKFEIPIYS